MSLAKYLAKNQMDSKKLMDEGDEQPDHGAHLDDDMGMDRELGEEDDDLDEHESMLHKDDVGHMGRGGDAERKGGKHGMGSALMKFRGLKGC